ncbi:MAG: toll/interleukin-1 receptor domain-containing protein [Alistipes sp.]|nr:toll/interleukin-1 receptor domain-containing protein [Alistipes sp.]
MNPEQKKYDVFISYSHEDKVVANAIYEYLQGKNIRCFIDSNDLQKGKNWSKLLPSAIRNSRLMLAIFSHNFNISSHTDHEIAIAANRKIPILVFRITDDDFEGTKEYYLTTSNWIEAFPAPDKWFGELYKNVCILLGIKTNTPTQQVENIVNQTAFAPEAELVKKGIAELRKMDGDRDLAAYYFRKAAKAGYPEAEYQLAMAYFDGNGIPHDLEIAIKWLRLAAEHGDNRALYMLGRVYHYGIGIERNPMKALELYTQSAELGNGRAMKVLGSIFKSGELGIQDEQRSKECYEQAYDTIYDKAFGECDPEAMVDLSYFYFDGENNERNYDYAVRLNQRATSYCYPPAFNNLGICYDSGMGLKKDLAKSHEMQLVAANLGLPIAMNNVSKNFLAGDGVEKSIEEYKEWRRRSAECGCVRAMDSIGIDYYQGENYETNLKKAQLWFEKAIRGGSLDAMNSLGIMYEHGDIESENGKEMAFNLYKQAALGGNVDAYYYLGNCYKEGIGTPVNDIEAVRWYLKIADIYDDMVSRETDVYTSNPGAGGLSYCNLQSSKPLFIETFKNLTQIYHHSETVARDLGLERRYKAIAAKLDPDYAESIKPQDDNIEQLEELLIRGDADALDKLLTIYHDNKEQIERLATYAVMHNIFPTKRDYVTGYDHTEVVLKNAKVEKHQMFIDYLSANLNVARSNGLFVNCYSLFNAVCREYKRGNMQVSDENWEYIRKDACGIIDEVFAPGYLRLRKEHFDVLFPGYSPERIANGDFYDERHFKLFYVAHTNYKKDIVSSDIGLLDVFEPLTHNPLRQAIIDSRSCEVVNIGELPKAYGFFISAYTTLCERHPQIKRVKLDDIDFASLVPIASIELMHERSMQVLKALISVRELMGSAWSSILENLTNLEKLLDIAEAMDVDSDVRLLIINYAEIQIELDAFFTYASKVQNTHLENDRQSIADELNAYVVRLNAHAIPHSLPHYTADNIPNESCNSNEAYSLRYISDSLDTGIESQKALADDYFYGQNGKGIDYEKAAKLYRMAANEGDAYAQYSLGYCYDKGRGVPRLPAEAVNWYRKAAEQNYNSAQISLGLCYENGVGVEKNTTEAVRWYTKAAEDGSARAQCNLGYCYTKGIGVDVDYNKAFEWLLRSAEQGNARAQDLIGDAYYYGRGVKQDRKEAVKWYRKSAEQDYPGAMYDLGWSYYKGQGVEQDYNEAFRLFSRSAEMGSSASQQCLGECYENGYGVDADAVKAVYWYNKAMKQDNHRSIFSMARCYENGIGVDKNISTALDLYNKLATDGHADAKKAIERLEAQISGDE